jgi:SAM-dependent methyltransferase
VGTDPDRERLRNTFGAAAASYQKSRPEYPRELFDDLVKTTGLRQGADLLEIGCATGKATFPLARLGFRITCVELSAALAAEARRNLEEFTDVEIEIGSFEGWVPGRRRFDLVFAATSWHWVDPTQRYRKAWEVLHRHGHVAIWSASHVFPEGGDPFFFEIQSVYDEIGEGLPTPESGSRSGDRYPRPGDLPDLTDEIQESGLFETVRVNHYDWEQIYNAEDYIALLSTFSGHIAMEPWQRDRLFSEIRRRLKERPDGNVRRHWGAVLHVARRLD